MQWYVMGSREGRGKM